MKLEIRPLTPELWPALEDLFGPLGACNGCWCMYWRIGSAYRKQSREANKAAFREIVEQGPPPGLIAFDGDLAVGWCQLTPRDALPWLDRTWRLKCIDDLPVWSISCFYLRKGYRRKGITSALISAAVKAAKAAGLEAYPLDADLTPSASGTGYATTFARAAFNVVACHTPPRPIMRLDLGASSDAVTSGRESNGAKAVWSSMRLRNRPKTFLVQKSWLSKTKSKLSYMDQFKLDSERASPWTIRATGCVDSTRIA